MKVKSGYTSAVQDREGAIGSYVTIDAEALRQLTRTADAVERIAAVVERIRIPRWLDRAIQPHPPS